ncbi:hypothetical protein DL96DRAFT_559128 [Flagelloscypha sp. PMI_526]|nr:hypothetical protein DL96DRAFT_559128 [Flagelloscypha sp. PMI_526]
MSWRYAVYALARRPAQRQGHDSVSSSALRLFSSSPNVFSAETSSRTSPAMTLYNRQLNTVLTALENPADYEAVWKRYQELIDLVGQRGVHLDIHQRVLRGCVPTTRRLGSIAKRKVGRHPYDRRVREIFHNISLAGHIPTLNAYHFVMHQFAVCGDYLSTMRMYHEILSHELVPTQQTFMLCLHSMALRLSFPVDRRRHASLTTRLQKLMSDVLADMKKHGIPPTAVIVDMMLRILKENVDWKTLDATMKWAYGIDLSHPDRPVAESSAHAEFTTSTLNTLINILGRLRMVSKLVQTFEVFTNPLPQNANQAFSQTFEDEDDFGAITLPEAPLFKYPSAKPNSTTYVFLIKGLCYTKQFNLARHYLIDAYRRDRRLSNEYLELATNLRTPLYAPRFSLSHDHLIRLYSLAAQHSKTGLLQWIRRKAWRLQTRRCQSLGVFIHYREQCIANGWLENIPQVPSEMIGQKPKSRAACLAQSKQYLQECRKTAAEVDWLTPYYAVRAKRPTVAALDLGKNLLLAVPPDENGKRPGKYMDVDVHINILKRDILLFNHLTKLVESALSRQHHKTVSTIGRRVWRGQDIFLRTHGRIKIGKTAWTKMAKYHPSRGLPMLGSKGKPNIKKIMAGEVVEEEGEEEKKVSLWRHWAQFRKMRQKDRAGLTDRNNPRTLP